MAYRSKIWTERRFLFAWREERKMCESSLQRSKERSESTVLAIQNTTSVTWTRCFMSAQERTIVISIGATPSPQTHLSTLRTPTILSLYLYTNPYPAKPNLADFNGLISSEPIPLKSNYLFSGISKYAHKAYEQFPDNYAYKPQAASIIMP